MLLPEKANPLENLASSGACSLEPLFQLRVFHLELLYTFRVNPSAAGRCVDRLHSRLGLKRAPAKARQLVTEMSYELLKLVERLHVRTFVV